MQWNQTIVVLENIKGIWAILKKLTTKRDTKGKYIVQAYNTHKMCNLMVQFDFEQKNTNTKKKGKKYYTLKTILLLSSEKTFSFQFKFPWNLSSRLFGSSHVTSPTSQVGDD